jgi:hypothetical protein
MLGMHPAREQARCLVGGMAGEVPDLSSKILF